MEERGDEGEEKVSPGSSALGVRLLAQGALTPAVACVLCSQLIRFSGVRINMAMSRDRYRRMGKYLKPWGKPPTGATFWIQLITTAGTVRCLKLSTKPSGASKSDGLALAWTVVLVISIFKGVDSSVELVVSYGAPEFAPRQEPMNLAIGIIFMLTCACLLVGYCCHSRALRAAKAEEAAEAAEVEAEAAAERAALKEAAGSAEPSDATAAPVAMTRGIPNYMLRTSGTIARLAADLKSADGVLYARERLVSIVTVDVIEMIQQQGGGAEKVTNLGEDILVQGLLFDSFQPGDTFEVVASADSGVATLLAMEIVEARPSSALDLAQLGADDEKRRGIASLASVAPGLSGWTARVVVPGRARTGFKIAKQSGQQ